jgi:hypothetical protein
MAAFALEEFESAKASFEKGLEFDPVNSILKTWSRKCDAELEEGKLDPKYAVKNVKFLLLYY